MQSTFAYGLAKNRVNGLPSVRRVATAAQVGGRLSSPSSPLHAENGATSRWSSDDVLNEFATSSPASQSVKPVDVPRVASSPIAFAGLCSEQVATPRGNSEIRNSTTTSESESEVYPSKRGTLVDKTNPFIGYFQIGTEENDADVHAAKATPTVCPVPLPPSVHRGPLRTHSSATLSSLSALLTPQKNMTKWLQARGSCFPTFLNQRNESKYSKQQPQDKKLSHKAFLESLKWKHAAFVTTNDCQEEHKQLKPFKRTVSLPAAMSAKAAGTALPPFIPTSSKVGSTVTIPSIDLDGTFHSRLDQDFEVVGSLGQGGQGAVIKVRSKVDGCYYAIKKVVLPRATEVDGTRAERQALREVRLMASMVPHPNVVRYHTAWTEIDACSTQTLKSSESVRGSVVSLIDSQCSAQNLQRQQLELLDEEAELRMSNMEAESLSFSLDFSSDSLSFDEYSVPGFVFEDEREGQDSSCRTSEGTNDDNRVSPLLTAEPVVMKPQIILYIQMELCGTAANAVPLTATEAGDHKPVHQFLNQLMSPLQERQQLEIETHSNLGAWLRSSLKERSAWTHTSEIHQVGLNYILGAVQGVAHMHSYDVIHRDIKPDNIFLHGDLAKIGDFGLSKSVYEDSMSDKALSPRERLQQYGFDDGNHTTALGTFTYASPEQLGYRFNRSDALLKTASRFKCAKYSIKSDIFALGVILLELCCPFSTMMERSQVLTGVRHGVVPQKARQHFPMEMDLVLRMTSIDPSERPTSEEVGAHVRQIMASSSPLLTPLSAIEELRALQAKLVASVRQMRDRSQATIQLEALVFELNEKVQNFIAIE